MGLAIITVPHVCCLCAACVLPVSSMVTRSVNTRERSKFYLFQLLLNEEVDMFSSFSKH